MRIKKISLITIITILLAIFILYPLDIYISKPGGAYDLAPLVTVVDGDEDDEGSFSLMTIALSKATGLTYVYAQISDRRKILPVSAVRQKDEDEDEYNVRQKNLMSTSQFNAIYVAFSKLGLPFEESFNGILVMNVEKGGAAEQYLLPGDKVLSIDEQPIDHIDGFLEYIATRKVGDLVKLQVNRENEVFEQELALKEIPNHKGRVGLGVGFREERTIQTNPEVMMKTSNIGGPSAGLMYTLEIINQIEDEDLTKGYNVAGTGTMESDGTVGRIGGMDFKVMAADRDGVDIFFAPEDNITKQKKSRPDILSNYEEAVKTAEKIGTKMTIVPVKTIDDALLYLEQLAPKS